MTKRHFELIANVVANANISDEGRERIALDFATALGNENDLFDASRFLKACNVGPAKA